MLNDNGLAQMVEEPKRGENTLDLVISNNPSCMTRVHTLPGISGHGIVFAEVDMKIKKKIQKPRSIPLYKKAKWDTMKEELAGLMDKLNELDNMKTCVNEMWCVFKNHLEEIVKKHVPHKIAKTKESLPWITPDIRKLTLKRDRLYKQNKKSGNTTTAKKLKDIKRKVQKELRRAYWNYIEEIVTPQENNNQYSSMKRFQTYMYIKHKRTNRNGITPLRSDGLLHSDPTDQSNILNKQFQSAFSEKINITKEQFNKKCQMNGQFPSAPEINITSYYKN